MDCGVLAIRRKRMRVAVSYLEVDRANKTQGEVQMSSDIVGR